MTSLLLLCSVSHLVSAHTQETLRDYPHCGELGDEAKKECFWDCDWEDLPSSLDIHNRTWLMSQRPTSTLCLKDCPPLQDCLDEFLPIYTDIINSGNITNLYQQVYLPYFDCLFLHSTPIIAAELMPTIEGDSIYYLIYLGCALHLLDPDSKLNCFNEFIEGKKRYRRVLLNKRDKRRLSKLILSYIQTADPLKGRLYGFSSGNYRTENDIGRPYVNINNTLGQYPWLCSLKTRGFRGQHQCGVTLLSAPPATTVMVSAAHCNFVCRDNDDYIVETCCCREDFALGSCRTFSPYCGVGATLRPARPEDLQIVCREWDIGSNSLTLTIEEDLVLTVTGYTNHPQFDIATGPAGGYDISVYRVDDSPLVTPGVLQRRVLWPACLPSIAHRGRRGIMAGWRTPFELAHYYTEFQLFHKFQIKNLFETVEKYRQENLILRHIGVENVTCADPAWMKSDSPYPAGTVCARDSTMQSCFDTGDSGSGLMMERLQGGYSWEGALSAYKGCDGINIEGRGPLSGTFQGENPGIFTQGSCYLPWIASAYGLSLGPGLSQGCRAASGNPKDVEQECLSSIGKPCLFNTGLVYNFTETDLSIGVGVSGTPTNQCILGGAQSINVQMIYYCFIEVNNLTPWNSTLGVCANNCRGVRTSDIIAGGAVVLAAASVALQSAAFPGIGLSLLGMGMTGVAGVGMASMMCLAPLFCRTGAQCCLIESNGQGGARCPPSC